MPLFDGIDDEQYFYFSYYLSAKDSYVTSEAYYGVEFAASIRSGKFLWSSIPS